MKIETLINEVIVLPKSFGIPEKSETIRNELLAVSGEFKVATNAPAANSLGEAARDIRSFVAEVRALGMALRRPLKAAHDRIKAIEDDYCLPLEQEQERLESIAEAFHAAEKHRVAEEERLRRENLARLERDRLALEQKAREAQEKIDRENREAAARAQAALDAAKNKKQRDTALRQERERQEALAKQQAAADEASLKAQEAAAASEAAMRAPMPECHKVAGVSTKRVMEFEVVDIKAVFAARPELCEPLAIKKSAVRAVCTPRFLPNSNEVDETSVPGLKLWWQDQTSTKRWER